MGKGRRGETNEKEGDLRLCSKRMSRGLAVGCMTASPR